MLKSQILTMGMLNGGAAGGKSGSGAGDSMMYAIIGLICMSVLDAVMRALPIIGNKIYEVVNTKLNERVQKYTNKIHLLSTAH